MAAFFPSISQVQEQIFSLIVILENVVLRYKSAWQCCPDATQLNILRLLPASAGGLPHQ